MEFKSKSIIAGIFVCFFLLAGSSIAADFDITIVSGGDNPTITIWNNSSLPAYVYDLVKADGSTIGVHSNVIDSATIQVNGDLTGVVEVRCVAAENAFNGWEDYMHNPESKDGFFHYSASIN